MREYAIDTLFASEYHTGDTEEIETIDALKAPDRTQFITAIKKEIHSLTTETRTLIPITRSLHGYIENTTNRRVWKIHTTLKCKRKKKSNGEPDKHKARAAARGDTLRRAMIKAKVPLPPSYSPTIMPLTFALFLQLAVIHKLHMATMDIKSAYLNAALPPDADWIITTLEPHIAEVCGLDPKQEYRIANALYGLPDSGRIFYLHYKNALLAEGYTMSQFDHCLFFRISPTETTYIIVYVDDTFIFSNTQANIDQVITSVGRHYEVTLDRDASSFLGLSLTHNPDGTELPAVIMEDNSAVVTMSNNDTGYAKKCKHFLMVINYVKEQIDLGQIEARKIYGKLNTADMHTKPLRTSSFSHMAHRILGHPAPILPIIPPSLPSTSSSTETVAVLHTAMETTAQSQLGMTRKRKRTPDSLGATRRKAHILRYVTPQPTLSIMDT